MRKNYYIAYSIHGTETFIVATKKMSVVPKGFTVKESRRPSYKPEDGIKLEWKGLCTKAGTPYVQPSRVLKAFKDLEEQGWDVDSKAFIQRHYAERKAA